MQETTAINLATNDLVHIPRVGVRRIQRMFMCGGGFVGFHLEGDRPWRRKLRKDQVLKFEPGTAFEPRGMDVVRTDLTTGRQTLVTHDLRHFFDLELTFEVIPRNGDWSGKRSDVAIDAMARGATIFTREAAYSMPAYVELP